MKSIKDLKLGTEVKAIKSIYLLPTNEIVVTFSNAIVIESMGNKIFAHGKIEEKSFYYNEEHFNEHGATPKSPIMRRRFAKIELSEKDFSNVANVLSDRLSENNIEAYFDENLKIKDRDGQEFEFNYNESEDDFESKEEDKSNDVIDLDKLINRIKEIDLRLSAYLENNNIKGTFRGKQKEDYCYNISKKEFEYNNEGPNVRKAIEQAIDELLK